MNDLYRLGFLGNFFPGTKSYHWQHKGDSQLILTDEWRFVIHYALHNSLSLRTQNDWIMNRAVGIQPGDTAKIIITRVIKSFACGTFEKYGNSYDGQIHISEFSKLGYGFIPNLPDVVNPGDEFEIVVEQYIEKYRVWNLTLNNSESVV